MNDRTMTFSIGDQTEQIIRNTLIQVYDALKEKVNGSAENIE